MLVPKAFLFAHPAKHSLSPAMHNAALANLGIEAAYLAKDISQEELAAELEQLRHSDAWGCNLSIPHKEHALKLMDWLSSEAQAIGAVNTVVVRDQKLLGYNTDAYGFMRSLEEAGIHVQDAKVVVLGAGGAARAVACGLKYAGAFVALWNRNTERAKVLCAELGLATHLTDDLLAAALSECDGLVNTTSVGLEQPMQSPIPDTLLSDGLATRWVCDIVYRPLETRLLRTAREKKYKTVDGLGMLVHQGARAFELWTGQKPDTETMRNAALEQLNQ
ncbi:MAG: shikimate dehydrogenase [Deinococcales bacterium]